MAIGAITAVTLSPRIPDAFVVVEDTGDTMLSDGPDRTGDNRDDGLSCRSRIAEVTPPMEPGRVGFVAVKVGTAVSLGPMETGALSIMIGTGGLDYGDKGCRWDGQDGRSPGW